MLIRITSYDKGIKKNIFRLLCLDNLSVGRSYLSSHIRIGLSRSYGGRDAGGSSGLEPKLGFTTLHPEARCYQGAGHSI